MPAAAWRCDANKIVGGFLSGQSQNKQTGRVWVFINDFLLEWVSKLKLELSLSGGLTVEDRSTMR